MSEPGDVDPGSLRSIEALADLVSRTELVGITYYELSARRADAGSPDHDMGPAAEAAPWGGPDGEVFQALRVMVERNPEHIEVRCEGRFSTPDASYVTDVGARFLHEEPLDVADDVLNEFVQRVGVMAVWPYLREAVRDLSAKIDAGRVVIGLIRAGQVELTEEPPEGSPWEQGPASP